MNYLIDKKIIKALIKINCTRTNLDTLSFRSKEESTLDVYKILNKINELWNLCKWKDKIFFKLKFEKFLEIFVKEDNLSKKYYFNFEFKNKKRILESCLFWLKFFIDADTSYDLKKLEIYISNIKTIYFQPQDIHKLLINKIKEIELEISNLIENIGFQNLLNCISKKDFFDFRGKETFNFFMYMFFYKNRKKLNKIENLISDKAWFSNNFFKSFFKYLFGDENVDPFLKQIDTFVDSCCFLLKHVEWLNYCTEANVEFSQLEMECSINTKKEEKFPNIEGGKFFKEELINCNILNFFQLLHLLKKSYFSISYYQRSYVWTSELIENLFKNILECQKDSKHYLNHILVKSQDLSIKRTQGGTNKVEIFEIIDGQQRIISLIIIYVICIKYGYWNKFKIDSEYLDFLNTKWSINEHFFYSPEKNNKNLLNKILKLNFKIEKSTTKNKSFFVDNVSKIMSLINIEIDNQEEFKLFLNKLMEDFIFSFTKINFGFSQKNSIDIFETFKNLNSKGIQLNSLDLLNSYLFQKNINDKYVKIFLKHANNEEINESREEFDNVQREYEKYKEYISILLQNRENSEAIIKTFNKTICKGGLNNVLKDQFNSKININVNFENLKNIIELERHENLSNNLLNDLLIINRYLKKYLELFNKEKQKTTENNLIKDNLDYLTTLSKKDVCKPFVYKLFESVEKFVKQKTHISKLKWIRPILYILETFIVRNTIYQPGLSYTKIYDKLLDKLDEHVNQETSFTYKELWQIIKDEIPKYEDMKSKFEFRNYKINDTNITKLILAKLEVVFQKRNFKIWDENGDTSIKFLKEDYQIDHLVAKKDETFKGVNLETQEIKEAIGNKMLLYFKENRTFSNWNIFEKIEWIIGPKGSGCVNKNLLLSEIEYDKFFQNPYFVKKFDKDEHDKKEKEFILDKFQEIQKEKLKLKWENKNKEEKIEWENKKLEDIIVKRSKIILNWINLIWNYNTAEWIENMN